MLSFLFVRGRSAEGVERRSRSGAPDGLLMLDGAAGNVVACGT
jgi:hypothetical protein